MKYLIINADDFGLNAGVNRGIIMAWEAGAITNATLMIKREGSREALDYALSNRSFSVGLHLDIDDIVAGDRKGSARFEKNYLKEKLKDGQVLKRIEKEIGRQMALFEKSGLELSHIDSHHHLHALPEVFNILMQLIDGWNISTIRIARDYDLVRYPSIKWNDAFYEKAIRSLKKKGIHRADHFLPLETGRSLNEIPEGITEIMTHPGKDEAWRKRELEFLISARWKALIEQNNVKLISFRDLTVMTADERI